MLLDGNVLQLVEIFDTGLSTLGMMLDKKFIDLRLSEESQDLEILGWSYLDLMISYILHEKLPLVSVLV